jgi:multidrug resistance efflux pump
MSAPIFAEWRAEIAAELVATEKELTEATAHLATAEAALASARADYRAAQAAMRPLQQLSAPLAMRLEELRRCTERQTTDVLQAKNSVERSAKQVGHLRQALADLAQIAPPSDAVAA